MEVKTPHFRNVKNIHIFCKCVICVNAKATMQTSPCGHRVVCRKCFVKTIQMAVSQRLLPLRCVICRAKILRLKQSGGGLLPGSTSSWSVPTTHSKNWLVNSASHYSMGPVPNSESLYSMASGSSSISETTPKNGGKNKQSSNFFRSSAKSTSDPERKRKDVPTKHKTTKDEKRRDNEKTTENKPSSSSGNLIADENKKEPDSKDGRKGEKSKTDKADGKNKSDKKDKAKEKEMTKAEKKELKKEAKAEKKNAKAEKKIEKKDKKE
ncbi:unnamed protein product [Nesidiocoris tenuis]|uniref:RING-type domain-containing protein n=1 Tax=Nesidiocoris tenuis TaxID=355587 RepID=A0A6H5H2Y1_9HEMI|nr:unnamed protein product [Nesidiocoris tenuis]